MLRLPHWGFPPCYGAASLNKGPGRHQTHNTKAPRPLPPGPFGLSSSPSPLKTYTHTHTLLSQYDTPNQINMPGGPNSRL